MKTKLNELIVSVFRKRQTLSYYQVRFLIHSERNFLLNVGIQGYHDIISVLFLTLPPEIQLVSTEKLSLYRLRDSMGTGLEPLVGLLRCVHRLGVCVVFKLNIPC